MEFIDFIFLFYIFVGFYILSLFLIIYFQGRKKIFEYPKCIQEPVSIVIPCYNEGESIEDTIKHILNLNYPKKLLEIIIVDDCSTDNSWEIIQKYKKIYQIKVLRTEKNSGSAATPRNIGIKAAKSKYVLVIDADSIPEKDSLNKMLGFMQQDSLTAAVTPIILTKPPKTFIQKMQHIEYDVIAFIRKLLGIIDSIYVTPGAFALYRRDAIIKVGMLDPKNMTEDIEIIWRFLANGYNAKMSFAAKSYTETPSTFKSLLKQRERWNIGGYQTLNKYKKLIFKRGMLGNFIIPYFAFSLLLNIAGICLFIYLIAKRILVYALSLKYSIQAASSLFYLEQMKTYPSTISFLGAALLIFAVCMTLFSIAIIKTIEARKRNALNMLVYLSVYSLIYPLITIKSLIRVARGNYKW